MIANSYQNTQHSTIKMSDPVTIRFTDNQTGRGANADVATNGQCQTVSKLVAGSERASVGFLTSIELERNFTDVMVELKVHETEVAILTIDNNSMILPTRAELNFTAIKVTRA